VLAIVVDLLAICITVYIQNSQKVVFMKKRMSVVLVVSSLLLSGCATMKDAGEGLMAGGATTNYAVGPVMMGAGALVWFGASVFDGGVETADKESVSSAPASAQDDSWRQSVVALKVALGGDKMGVGLVEVLSRELLPSECLGGNIVGLAKDSLLNVLQHTGCYSPEGGKGINVKITHVVPSWDGGRIQLGLEVSSGAGKPLVVEYEYIFGVKPEKSCKQMERLYRYTFIGAYKKMLADPAFLALVKG
jgi:predicted small secreted protein